MNEGIAEVTPTYAPTGSSLRSVLRCCVVTVCCACTCSVSQCAVCVFGIAPVVGLSFSRLLALRRYSIGCSQVAGGASYCMCMLVKRLRVDGGVRSRVVSDTRDFNAVIYTLQLDQHQIVSATQRYTPRCENHTAAPSRVDGRLDRGPVPLLPLRAAAAPVYEQYTRASPLSLSLSSPGAHEGRGQTLSARESRQTG